MILQEVNKKNYFYCINKYYGCLKRTFYSYKNIKFYKKNNLYIKEYEKNKTITYKDMNIGISREYFNNKRYYNKLIINNKHKVDNVFITPTVLSKHLKSEYFSTSHETLKGVNNISTNCENIKKKKKNEQQKNEEKHVEEKHNKEEQVEQQHNKEEQVEQQHNKVNQLKEQHNKVNQLKEQHNKVNQSKEQHNKVNQLKEQHNKENQSKEQHNKLNHSKEQHNKLNQLKEQHNKEFLATLKHSNVNNERRVYHEEREDPINKDNEGKIKNANTYPHINKIEDNRNEHIDMINILKKKKIIINEKETKITKFCNKSNKALKCVISILKKTSNKIKIIILQPSILKVYYENIKKNIRHTIVWVKTGILLFLTNMKISKNLIIKRLKGYRLSYSEYKLLIRTMNDMFKLIPFSFFIIIPFAEFLLPIFLKIYPNLLPSTFKNDDNFNNIKKNLYAKEQLAKFLQQLIEEKEKQLNENIGIDSDKKKNILNKFHQQLINKDEKDINPFLSVNDTLKIAKIFKEDFVLDQMNLKTLQTICHLLGLKPYGIHYHVVLQLRHHFLRLQREDRELIYEGVDNLKHNSLVEICRDRGMNFNTTEKEMKVQIQQWLQLASIKEVPYILLLYIRCVVVTHAIMDIHDEQKKNQNSQNGNNNSNKGTTNNNINSNNNNNNNNINNNNNNNNFDNHNNNIAHSSHIDDKQKLIQEAKEKLDDLKMKEQEIKKNINKQTEEEDIHNKENNLKVDFVKKNKYLQNELNMLKRICDLQHKELKIAFTSLTELAEKKQSCDINQLIKNMSQRLLDIEKHISELNVHKQVDEYFYPEDEKIDDSLNVKN
ncbi:LETM1-like protein, putative [Plasmodium reichenowi]|uniref:LETM1-like protein, putative n=1 Tax=Plasmodium reichenowi TaxID=5854 RepID=A0A151LSH1_PLARE|nr:LETM1-like protein, putative [Plasmodium reichenowi]KYO02138.1 LETM1-like protein, putative [Plasmodium reichenowi]